MISPISQKKWSPSAKLALHESLHSIMARASRGSISLQAKAAVETVGRFGQIAPLVLALTDSMVGAANGSFEIAQHDIGPARAAARRPLVCSTVCG